MITTESGVALMDQYVEVGRRSEGKSEGLEALAPLAHVGLPPGGTRTSVAEIAAAKLLPRTVVSTVRLEALTVVGVLLVRADRGAHAELTAALESTLQLALPTRLASAERGGRYCIRWVSPDEWLLTCPLKEAFDIENRLRAAISEPVAIVNASGGYGVLILSGEDALQVLKKSTAYDVHPDNFSDNKVVNTIMAKAQVSLRVAQGNRYEIIVRRSFADYLWLWLQRAGKEFGLEAVTVGN